MPNLHALGRRGVADEEQIVAGIGRAHGRFTDGARLAHRTHLEIVGHDDAAEADLFAQIVLDDESRERRGHAGGIEVRVDRM